MAAQEDARARARNAGSARRRAAGACAEASSVQWIAFYAMPRVKPLLAHYGTSRNVTRASTRPMPSARSAESSIASTP